MRMTDRDASTECAIIPFHRPITDTDTLTTTSIAAVIAVTILHSEGESAEDKLMEIIEATGEAEVLDADDALFALDECNQIDVPAPTNDNQAMTLV